MNEHLRHLLNLLLANPNIAQQIQLVHDLAIYESGDAHIGQEEKEALQIVKHLTDYLKQIPRQSIIDIL